MYPKIIYICLFITSYRPSIIFGHANTVESLNTERDTCEKGNANDATRYLLYSVNPGEGFNLRRDVYLRMANLVLKLNDFQHWTLILPPWGALYHWKNTPRDEFHDWGDYFDLKSLKKWVPVMEFEEYVAKNGHHIDVAYTLQHFAEGWGDKWDEKYEKRDCIEKNSFWQNSNEKWQYTIWNYLLSFGKFSCLSFQGQASTIIPLLTEDLKNSKSILLDRAETLLHDEFGGYNYWAARRSMRFATHLVKEATKFIEDFIDSNYIKDHMDIPADWRDFKPKRGSANGGNYVATHMRRRDFIYARKDEVPSIKETAEQLEKVLHSFDLRVLFVASDAPEQEIEELKLYLKSFEVLQYKPSKSFLEEWGDGGVAIVDQIICSHARYFTGSFESTFSFRIQEEREILGFPINSTFNRLCGQNPACEQPSKWKIVFE